MAKLTKMTKLTENDKIDENHQNPQIDWNWLKLTEMAKITKLTENDKIDENDRNCHFHLRDLFEIWLSNSKSELDSFHSNWELLKKKSEEKFDADER